MNDTTTVTDATRALRRELRAAGAMWREDGNQTTWTAPDGMTVTATGIGANIVSCAHMPSVRMTIRDVSDRFIRRPTPHVCTRCHLPLLPGFPYCPSCHTRVS